MSKLKIILSLTGLAAVALPVWQYIAFVGSTEALAERFPDVPKDVVWDVHKEIFVETLRGKYSHIEDDADGSTGEYDRIFLEKVQKYTK